MASLASPNPSMSSFASSSSFVTLSDLHYHSTTTQLDDSDDEIVYSISIGSDIASDIGNDFVILSRPRSQAGLSTPNDVGSDDEGSPHHPSDQVAELASNLADFKLDDTRVLIPRSPHRRKKAKKALKPSPVVTQPQSRTKKRSKENVSIPREVSAPRPPHGPSKSHPHLHSHSQPKRKTTQHAAASKSNQPHPETSTTRSGLGARSIVDDSSERLSDIGDGDVGIISMYDEAFKYITSFLSNPAARKDSACRLTLLQALIVELGLATSSLPASLSSARAFLKSRAFLNVREYLAVRDQGPAAVQNILHPTRTSLIKDIRKRKNRRAPLGWVKDSGLQVLLVHCYH